MIPPERPEYRTRPLAERAKTIPLPAAQRLRSEPIYRPASYLSLIAILVPIVAVGVAAKLLRDVNQRAPIWMPILILVFSGMLALATLFMRNVRLSANGVAVGRPFQRWNEAPWQDITHAERRGIFIRIETRGGTTIAFAPRLLTNGNQLLTMVLDNLRPENLDGALRIEALDHIRMPDSGMTGILRARPRNRWPFMGFALALLGVAGALLALVTLGAPLAVPLAVLLCVVGALVALSGAILAIWCLQEVIVTPESMTIVRPWRRSAEEVAWAQVRVIDHTPHWALMRLHMESQAIVRSIGPGLLRGPERARMAAFIEQYCLQRRVLDVPRKVLL